MMMLIRFQPWRPAERPFAPFLKRLPEEMGAELVCLSMADHYVEVRTTNGSTMILMRFADALKELRGYPGQQVHRSHWAAEKHVRSLERNGSRHVLKLDGGIEVPVSKAYLGSVRAMLARNEERRIEELKGQGAPASGD